MRIFVAISTRTIRKAFETAGLRYIEVYFVKGYEECAASDYRVNVVGTGSTVGLIRPKILRALNSLEYSGARRIVNINIVPHGAIVTIISASFTVYLQAFGHL